MDGPEMRGDSSAFRDQRGIRLPVLCLDGEMKVC